MSLAFGLQGFSTAFSLAFFSTFSLSSSLSFGASFLFPHRSSSSGLSQRELIDSCSSLREAIVYSGQVEQVFRQLVINPMKDNSYWTYKHWTYYCCFPRVTCLRKITATCNFSSIPVSCGLLALLCWFLALLMLVLKTADEESQSAADDDETARLPYSPLDDSSSSLDHKYLLYFYVFLFFSFLFLGFFLGSGAIILIQIFARFRRTFVSYYPFLLRTVKRLCVQLNILRCFLVLMSFFPGFSALLWLLRFLDILPDLSYTLSLLPLLLLSLLPLCFLLRTIYPFKSNYCCYGDPSAMWPQPTVDVHKDTRYCAEVLNLLKFDTLHIPSYW